MWIVQLALRRPHTFIVMAVLIVFLGGVSIRRTPTDIFPEIGIPVVSVIWEYGGMSTKEMESRITTYSEYTISSTVNDVKSIQSQTLNGISVIKIFFHPNVNIASAVAQVTAISQTILAAMPPGMPITPTATATAAASPDNAATCAGTRREAKIGRAHV